MATYRTIASTETDAASPVTTTLVSALANNPTAIAEGAAGAPRVVGRALDVFSAEGTINRTSVGTITAVTDTGLTNIDRVLIAGWLKATDAGVDQVTATATYELSSDGGSSWGTGVEIARATGTDAITALSFCVDTSAHDAIRVRVTYSGSGDEAEILAQIIHLGGS
jgi:hypothetical protein